MGPSSPSWPGEPPKALLTDIFGTVVDWRSSVTTHLAWSASSGLNDSTASLPSTVRAIASIVDWEAFAWDWRRMYFDLTRNYGSTPTKDGQGFVTVDRFFRQSLDVLVEKHGVEGLWTPAQVDEIARVWHRLHPSSDSVRGLEMLRDRGFVTATLSNGNTQLLKDLLQYAKLPYSTILSAEDFGAFNRTEGVPGRV